MGWGVSAHVARSHADPIVPISHGYELICERGFCNGVADTGVRFTFIGSDRTDVPRLQPGVAVVNLRGSQAPQRSRFGELVALLRNHARLVWQARSQCRLLHVFGCIHAPVLAGIIEGFLILWLAQRNTLAIRERRPHVSRRAWQRWRCPLSKRLVDTLLLASYGLGLPLHLVVTGACPYPALTRARRAKITVHPSRARIGWGSRRVKGGATRAQFAGRHEGAVT